MQESKRSPMWFLNEDLDYMTRVLAPGPKIAFPDDPDEDPVRNPMIADDLDSYYPTVAPNMPVDQAPVEDPLAPLDYDGDEDLTAPTGCGVYTDLDLDDYYGNEDETVDPGDLLTAVLTLFKAAVG